MYWLPSPHAFIIFRASVSKNSDKTSLIILVAGVITAILTISNLHPVISAMLHTGKSMSVAEYLLITALILANVMELTIIFKEKRERKEQIELLQKEIRKEKEIIFNEVDKKIINSLHPLFSNQTEIKDVLAELRKEIFSLASRK